MVRSALSVEHRLLVLASAIQEQGFREDTEKICDLLIQAADTITELRSSAERPSPQKIIPPGAPRN
jgi:hypothetical protein